MIAELRDQLVADLTAGVGVPVLTAWPERPPLPCVVVVPAGVNYVVGGELFGEYVLSLDVLALVRRDAGPGTLRALDGLLEAILANSVDWGLVRVDPPSLVSVGQLPAVGCLANVSKAFRLS